MRPLERDEVLAANARELFERGGKVNKDTEEAQNEMAEKKKKINVHSTLRFLIFSFLSPFFLSLPAGRGLLPCDSCSFSG